MIVAIDPGKSGGCVIVGTSGYVPIPWKDREQMARSLEQYPITEAVIEEVRGTATLTAPAVFKFGQNYGEWLGILAAFEIPVTFIKPQTWQKSLKLGEPNYGKRKTKLYQLAKQRFSDHGKITRATCDAWLILEHYLNENDETSRHITGGTDR